MSTPVTNILLVGVGGQGILLASEILAETFMLGDYMTCLECFTVLETCSGTISIADKSGISGRLKSEIDTYDTAKQQLARELIAVMRV